MRNEKVGDVREPKVVKDHGVKTTTAPERG